MIDTSGFYKLADGHVFYAPNAVHNINYTLSRDTREKLPAAGGWQWFDDRSAAQAAMQATDDQMDEALAFLSPVTAPNPANVF